MDTNAIREKFPITQRLNYQDHAAVAPLSAPAAEAIAAYAREYAENAYTNLVYYRAAEQTRMAAAKLIGAHPDEVTFIKNTSEGINFVASGIQWAAGDNIVSNAMEFPANVFPWMNLEHRNVFLRTIHEVDGRIPFDQIAARIDSRTRLVAVSAVQWSNGFRTDLTRLGELCKDKGVLLCVDAIQALGVHPIDVRRMNIDFLAADGHKWLCAPEGIGIFYCRRELLGHLRPSCVGYLCMKGDYDTTERRFDLRDDARRFDSGAYNLVGIAALGASIRLLLEVGIEEVQRRVKALTDQLVEGVKQKGWQVHSPRTSAEWSGIVSFSSDKHDLLALKNHLLAEFKIVISRRLGRLRASPHFYNTPDEIDQLVSALPAAHIGR